MVSRLSLKVARNRSARSCTAASARAGLLRVRAAIVFMLLKRKCGRMRAWSACTRAAARSSTLMRHVEVAQREPRDDQPDPYVAQREAERRLRKQRRSA